MPHCNVASSGVPLSATDTNGHQSSRVPTLPGFFRDFATTGFVHANAQDLDAVALSPLCAGM